MLSIWLNKVDASIWRKALTGLCIMLYLVGQVHVALAQDSSIATKLQPVLEQAEKDGSTIIVISPQDDAATSVEEVVESGSAQQQLVAFRNEIARIISRAPHFPGSVIEALSQARSDGSTTWIVYAIVLALVATVVGRMCGRLLDSWGREHFKYLYRSDPDTRSEKLTYALFRALLSSLMVGVFFLVSGAIIYAVAADDDVVRITAIIIVATVAIVRIVRVVSLNLLLPDAPTHRLLKFEDATAVEISKRLTQVFVISGSFLALCTWMDILELDRDAHKLALVTALLVAALLLSWVASKYKEPIAHAIRGGREPTQTPVTVRLIARFWHVFAVLYFMCAWGISSVRLVLDLESAFGLVVGPIVVLAIGLALYGLALLIIDYFFDKESEAGSSLPALQADKSQEVDDDVASQEVAEEAQTDDRAASPFKSLTEHAAGLLIVVIGVSALLQLWGADLFDKNSPFVRLLDIGIIVFMAYVAYQAVQIWVNLKRAEEGDVDTDEPGGDPGGAGTSRLVTLLPIFRNFLLITIVVIAGMIVLSELGVDIAPLFAGAGVIGLAIGFGAQTLIRDIFSGAFFLIDDAFRKGEYIDIGSAKGTVEKISIRSFQLRHHRGALNTVPFGEIKQLTNYSRDWVMMKLPIRVTYDTDLEKVRKLVKKLGQQLLEDPDVGDKFLQPLKSQGVAQMEDSAMIIRLKFMTRPGDQFQIRTKVFTKIRELFEQEGIKFAHREVTVRVNGDLDNVSEADKTAIAAAALPATEGQEPARPAKDNP